ncbi:MAG: glycosyltransferase [Bacteroidales bacterium]|nr:glycosyltransferase [Candidatus Colimorpha onthohippi]
MKYSIIIPVYNRPDEVDELLDSLTHQTVKDFEVVVVEDGSTLKCEAICKKYEEQLTINYHYKDNSGPGPSRYFGVAHANGLYVLILDSDCVIPPSYIASIDEELSKDSCEAFGGPDRAHDSFTPIQKAISYGMTSFFTTGGIRGGKKKLDKFYPRSFNMGVKRSVYDDLGGFSNMRFGEDIDFSTRIFEKGYKCRLFPEAWVWHKRRTDMRKFFKQVFNSGIARINLTKRHPGTLKLVHLLPMAFTVGVIALIIATLILLIIGSKFWMLTLLPIVLYCLLIFIDASIKNKNVVIGLLSIEAAFFQLFGYGLGFIKAWWQRCILGRGEFCAYEKNFYK